MKREFENYIFDLYATLIRIHTNQEMPKLWRRTADLMAFYGPVYRPAEMKKKYRELIRNQEESIASISGTKWPEADVGEVFREMLQGPPRMNPYTAAGDPKSWDEGRMKEWIRIFFLYVQGQFENHFFALSGYDRYFEIFKGQGKESVPSVKCPGVLYCAGDAGPRTL